MAKLIFKTKKAIDFDAWVAQAKRFASIQDNVTANNLALDTTPKPAIIEIDYEKPLSTGFYGRVVYKQVFDKDVEILKDPLDASKGTTMQVQEQQRIIVDYKMSLPAATIEQLFAQVLPQLPSEITGYFAREHAAMWQIALADIVSHNTFNLPVEQWEPISL